MPTKFCSFITGAIYLFLGICGFVPALVYLPPERLRFYDMHIVGRWGFLFNWLPVNLPHNVIYILLGGFGILFSAIFATATFYCRSAFILTLTLALIGLLPLGGSGVWGLLPLFSWNIVLHAVTAILCYYYGFIYPLDLGGQELVPA